MLRHRKIGFFAVLGLALVMVLGAAAPALAQESGSVVVTASYGPELSIALPVTKVEFGSVPAPSTNEYEVFPHPVVPITITSTAPYATVLQVTDVGSQGGFTRDDVFNLDLTVFDPIDYVPFQFVFELEDLAPTGGSTGVSALSGTGTGLAEAYTMELTLKMRPLDLMAWPIPMSGALAYNLTFMVSNV